MQTSQDTDEFAALTQATEAPSHAVGPLTSWTIAPAVFGAGTILVGPSAAGPAAGTRAVVPPGVWGRSPDGAPQAFERTGWRLYEWAPERLIDQHRPIGLFHLTLSEALQQLRDAPPGPDWIERTVRAQLRVLRSLENDQGATRSGEAARAAAERRDALAREAETAFGRPLTSPGTWSWEDLASAQWLSER